MKPIKKLLICGLTLSMLFTSLPASAFNPPSSTVSADRTLFAAASSPIKKMSQKINGKTVTYLMINMNDSRIMTKLVTANDKINQAAPLKTMAASCSAAASINGTYFAAYNNAVPFPDGTVVKDSKPLHITDIGCTVGFTPDHKVLIDFVKTRVQGYINNEKAWVSYRVNRPTPDPSATVIYTEEYAGTLTLTPDLVGVVCQDGQVIKKLTGTMTVPKSGFILAMNTSRSAKYNIGDSVSYQVTFEPQNSSSSDWVQVTDAISAGPSLLINGKATPLPNNEGFTEKKILTASAQRSFIGTTADNQLVIGTASSNISDMKVIAKSLGLVNAMCLDGGASSGLYYNGQYLTAPGRNINNCINFIYKKE